jgi:hypothetical protein
LSMPGDDHARISSTGLTRGPMASASAPEGAPARGSYVRPAQPSRSRTRSPSGSG